MNRLAAMVLFSMMTITLNASATVWTVNVADFQFTPSTLAILQGDTVDWSNTLGFHNVRHNCDPSLFGNDPANAPWTYRFIFNVPTGNYSYQCDVHPDMMQGLVIVNRRTHWNVTVQNFSFTPQNLTILQGDTVIWTNISGFHNVHHNATPSLFHRAIANAPWTFSFVFNLPVASYPYICQQHPTLMSGTVNVTLPGNPQPPANLVAFEDSGLIRLDWSPACGATGYNIYASDDPSANPFATLLATTTDTSAVDTLDGSSGLKRFYLVKTIW